MSIPAVYIITEKTRPESEAASSSHTQLFRGRCWLEPSPLVPCPEYLSPLHEGDSLVVTCRLCTVYMGLNPLSITCHLCDLRQVAPHFYTLSYPIANKDFRIHHTGLLGKLNLIIHAKFLFFFNLQILLKFHQLSY